MRAESHILELQSSSIGWSIYFLKSNLHGPLPKLYILGQQTLPVPTIVTDVFFTEAVLVLRLSTDISGCYRAPRRRTKDASTGGGGGWWVDHFKQFHETFAESIKERRGRLYTADQSLDKRRTELSHKVASKLLNKCSRCSTLSTRSTCYTHPMYYQRAGLMHCKAYCHPGSSFKEYFIQWSRRYSLEENPRTS